jgi:hypothetical protein
MRNAVLLFALALPLAGLLASAQTAPTGPPRPVPSSPKTDIAKPRPPAGLVEILSDTQGVDFRPYLLEVHRITESAWLPLIPEEANPPTLLAGAVAIRFKILTSGRVKDGSMVLDGRSGHMPLDRAAWESIAHSDYPRLPEEFKGPFVEIRFFFLYNLDKKPTVGNKSSKTGGASSGQAGIASDPGAKP